jgi:ankyrin repeat protein
MTKLHEIAVSGDLAELPGVLASGVDIDAKDQFGATALHRAVSEKRVDIALALVARGADLTVQDPQGRTPLHWAIEHGLFDAAAAMVRTSPAVLEIADAHGNQPLWTATFKARKGDHSLVALLLESGADVHHRNNVGLSPMDIPRRTGDSALMALLDRHNAPKNAGA